MLIMIILSKYSGKTYKINLREMNEPNSVSFAFHNISMSVDLPENKCIKLYINQIAHK